MKYISCADIHARSAKPVMRTDKNFLKTVLDKFYQIIILANIYDAHLLIAGDLFESATISYEVFNKIRDLLFMVINDVYIVAGQHDMKNHSPDIGLSPLHSLHSNRNGIYVMEEHQYKDVHGVQWGNKLKDKIIEYPSYETDTPILLTHKCVTPKKPPFFLEEAVSAKSMLKKHSDYPIIVTGDFHETHTTIYKNRILVNPGSMLRTKIDQIDHKPCVFLIDTDQITFEKIYLKVAPAKDVFDFSEIKKKKNKSAFQEEIKDLIDSLQIKAKSASFRKILNELMKQSNTPKDVKKYIKGILKNETSIL